MCFHAIRNVQPTNLMEQRAEECHSTRVGNVRISARECAVLPCIAMLMGAEQSDEMSDEELRKPETNAPMSECLNHLQHSEE